MQRPELIGREGTLVSDNGDDTMTVRIDNEDIVLYHHEVEVLL